jgi:hypothetical protein
MSGLHFSQYCLCYIRLVHSLSDRSGLAPLKRDGILVTDIVEKADSLNNQFQSVFTNGCTCPGLWLKCLSLVADVWPLALITQGPHLHVGETLLTGWLLRKLPRKLSRSSTIA